MKISCLAIVLAVIGCATDARAQLKPSTQIIPQPDAPVLLSLYAAAYHAGPQYPVNGVHHDVRFLNVSQKPIAAVQIGLVSFDVFNQFLDRRYAVSVQTLQPKLLANALAVAPMRAETGATFLTGVAFASRVRFADGEIWTADINQVIAGLRRIEKDFDAARLAEKNGAQ